MVYALIKVKFNENGFYHELCVWMDIVSRQAYLEEQYNGFNRFIDQLLAQLYLPFNFDTEISLVRFSNNIDRPFRVVAV